jgi:hypothetical protein
MIDKYFVISLPRSGTSSISKMAKVCGFNPIHAPHVNYKQRILSESFNFFSDTPIFCPQNIEDICENFKNINTKFIFIDRNFTDIFNSWKNVNLYNNYIRMYNSNRETLKLSMKFDLNSYDDAFGNQKMTEENYQEIFKNHKENVYKIIEKHNKEILTYKFEDGWEPFCNFLNVEVPKEDLPHLNKNKMFDKI